jgi:hypothetical protein
MLNSVDRVKVPFIKFHKKSCPFGAELLHWDGRMDGHKELLSDFRCFLQTHVKNNTYYTYTEEFGADVVKPVLNCIDILTQPM